MREAQALVRSAALPLELRGNHAHIAPEWEPLGEQRLWFVNAPYGGDVLRFRGEPTSLLYAIAPLVAAVLEADAAESHRFGSLRMRDLALLNPPLASDAFYRELENRLARQDLRVLAVSAMTAGSAEARRIARLAKARNPRTIVIFGGPHETQVPTRTAVDPTFQELVDFSVSGGGEFALLKLAEIIFSNDALDCDAVKELVYARRGELLECPGRGTILFSHRGHNVSLPLSKQSLNLDDLPLMPRELLCEEDTRVYSIFKRKGVSLKTAQIMTHRGCAWNCNFCTEAVALNLRSLNGVIQEIESVLNFSRNSMGLERNDYEAIFFDDSTFTTQAPRRRRYLAELFACLRDKGIEWGCQTRLDQMDEVLLKEMKAAGCTYLFTGMESASEPMLWSMQKGSSLQDLRRGFDAAHAAGLRLGVSLVFGAPHDNSVRTLETEATIRETVDFVSQQAERGDIVLVSPNVATYYPGSEITQQLLKVAVAQSLTEEPAPQLVGAQGGVAEVYDRITFRDPLVNRGYPWNRFEEGEGWHASNFGPAEAQVVLRECIRNLGEYLVSQDLYSVDGYQEAARGMALEEAGLSHAYLNHASIARPLPAAWAAARNTPNTPEAASAAAEAAREAATRLFGLERSQTSRVVLARNATEAMSLTYWLSGLWEKPSPRILVTSSENLSIPRAFRFVMDQANPDGRDGWCSFQDFGVRSWRQGPEIRETGARVEVLQLPSGFAGAPEEAILAGVSPDVRLVVFSHVLRESGYLMDVESLCRKLRRKCPKTLIVVDGAQALGALPPFSVDALDCDFYVGAPHKTLGSFPVGLLSLSERLLATAPESLRRTRLSGTGPLHFRGMFDRSWGSADDGDEELSAPELRSLVAALQFVEEKFTSKERSDAFVALDEHRRALKETLQGGLAQASRPLDLVSPVSNEFSNFILTFRLPGLDNRLLVETLWRQHLVFVSYIARNDVIRASFGPMNTLADLTCALGELATAIGEVERGKCSDVTLPT